MYNKPIEDKVKLISQRGEGMILEQLVKVELSVAITSFITILILLIVGGVIPSVLWWVFGASSLIALATTIYFYVRK